MGKYVIKNTDTNEFYCNLCDAKGYWDSWIGEAKPFNNAYDAEIELKALKSKANQNLVVKYIDTGKI